MAIAGVPDNAAVLDVGTGPGILLAELARQRPDLRLTGIDLSADMVTAAEQNLTPYGDRATVQVGDVTDLPFADLSFDLIVSSFSMHHWDDPEAAVPQLARVLRPGGRVCIYDFRFAPSAKLIAAALRQIPPHRTIATTNNGAHRHSALPAMRQVGAVVLNLARPVRRPGSSETGSWAWARQRSSCVQGGRPSYEPYDVVYSFVRIRCEFPTSVG